MAFKAKLSNIEAAKLVVDVRQYGMTQTAAALKYGVSRRTVNRILDPERGVSKKPPLKPCGTVAAYRRHLRKKEVPCLKCSAANAAYTDACKKKGAA